VILFIKLQLKKLKTSSFKYCISASTRNRQQQHKTLLKFKTVLALAPAVNKAASFSEEYFYCIQIIHWERQQHPGFNNQTIGYFQYVKILTWVPVLGELNKTNHIEDERWIIIFFCFIPPSLGIHILKINYLPFSGVQRLFLHYEGAW